MPVFSGLKKQDPKLSKNDIRQIMKGSMGVPPNQDEESIGDVDINKNSLDESSSSI